MWAKVLEHPSVRPSVHLELSPKLILWMCPLFFFMIFTFFVKNHLLGNIKLSFLVLWLRVTGLARKGPYISSHFCDPLPRLFKPFGFVKKHGRQRAGLIFPILSV